MSHSTLSTDLSKARFFGLDVHQKTITIAMATSFGDPQFVETIDNNPAAVARFFEAALKSPGKIYTVYEAGGCGYVLARQLEGMGIDNIVAAPTKIAKAKGEVVKNDKKDSIKLSRLLRNHVFMGQKELHAVYVPEVHDEAIREKTRQREAFKRHAKITQNRITGMLRRYGFRYNLTKTSWTKTYRRWLETVNFEHHTIQDVFREYLDQLADIEARVRQCDRVIDELSADWNKAQVVTAFRAFRGIQVLASANIVAEIGDFTRFDSPSKLMGFLGVTPTEYSSGQQVTRGKISKAGNKRLRTLLVEVVSTASRRPKPKAAFLATCPPGLPTEITDHAYKAQCRLYKKYWRLVGKGKNPNVAKIAITRELIGFIWAVGCMAQALYVPKTCTQKAA